MTLQTSWRTVLVATVAALMALVLAHALERAQPQAQGGGGGTPVQPPLQLPFQGRLLYPSGEPVPERSATVLFSLYESPTGGTAVWSSGPAAVEVKKGGMVNALLGDAAHPLSAVDFGRALYVGVRIDDPANAAALEKEPELLPRVQLLPAPYAHGAGTARDAEALAGHNWSAILMGGSNDPSAAKIRGDRIDERYTVPAGAIILWRGTTCPAGYRRVVELDGKFLVGGANYKRDAGGSNVHDHDGGSYVGPAHTHPMPDVDCMGWNAQPGGPGPCVATNAVRGASFVGSVTKPEGGGPISGRSGPADSRPEFATVILCECLERQ